MADLSNPNNQPSSTPFQAQQQGMNASVSVNTQPAQKAFADLQNVLDNIMKGFGGSWDKVSRDSTAAQERFYRYIGDKENERRSALKRYSNDALSAIDEETTAKIASLERQKLAHEEFEKRKTQLTQEAERTKSKIIEDTARKEKQSTSILGRIGGATSNVGGQIGGPIGGLVSGIGNVITNPAEIIPAALIGSVIEMMNTKAAFTGTGAQLAGAGLGIGASAGAGLGFATDLFGHSTSAFGRSLSMDQQRSIIGTMAGSRTMIDQATERGGMGALRGNLGLFANILPDASKEMEIFTDATKNLGMSQKEISNTFMTSRVNADRLKITQLDAISTQIEMQKALRNITNDGAVAASVLSNVGGFFQSIGKSEGESQRMTLGVARAGANLSLPQMAGMFSFTHGGMPTEKDLFGTNGQGGMLGKNGSGVFGLMGSFLSKVGGQFKDPMQRLFAADSLNKQLGLGIQTQDLPQFFNLSNKLMSGGISQKDFSSKVEDLTKHSKEMTVEGMDKLVGVVNPIQQLENVFQNFWRDLDNLLSKYFGSSQFNNRPSLLSQKNVKDKIRIQHDNMI